MGKISKGFQGVRHTPVLLQTVMRALNVRPGGKYIDATFGSGGYARAMLERGAQVLGIDRDRRQIEAAATDLKTNPDLRLVVGNFADIGTIARANRYAPAVGVVFDLGLSMEQIGGSGRGFSYRRSQERLDMRLDPETGFSAAELINRATVEALYQIFVKNSEEIRSRVIAQAIVQARKTRPIITAGDLVMAIERGSGVRDQKTSARIFQALRIAVNNEFENLPRGLIGAYELLCDRGRIVVVTFHSLEDRLVKRLIRQRGWSKIEAARPPDNRKNRYERSATVRIIEKHEKK